MSSFFGASFYSAPEQYLYVSMAATRKAIQPPANIAFATATNPSGCNILVIVTSIIELAKPLTAIFKLMLYLLLCSQQYIIPQEQILSTTRLAEQKSWFERRIYRCLLCFMHSSSVSTISTKNYLTIFIKCNNIQLDSKDKLI